MNRQLQEIINLFGGTLIEILQITKGNENQWFLEFKGNITLWYSAMRNAKHLDIETNVSPQEYELCPLRTLDNTSFICIEFN